MRPPSPAAAGTGSKLASLKEHWLTPCTRRTSMVPTIPRGSLMSVPSDTRRLLGNSNDGLKYTASDTGSTGGPSHVDGSFATSSVNAGTLGPSQKIVPSPSPLL